MEFYKSMDYFFITRMVSDWMRYAGPKARKEFSDQVKEHVWDARERTENSFERGYVFNFAADYSNEIYSAGEYLVYLLLIAWERFTMLGWGILEEYETRKIEMKHLRSTTQNAILKS